MGFLASLQADQALSKHRFCNFNLFAHLLFFNLFVHLPPFFKLFAHLLSAICSALCIFVHFLFLQSLCTLASLRAFCTSAVLQSLCTFAGLQALCTSIVRHLPFSETEHPDNNWFLNPKFTFASSQFPVLLRSQRRLIDCLLACLLDTFRVWTFLQAGSDWRPMRFDSPHEFFF